MLAGTTAGVVAAAAVAAVQAGDTEAGQEAGGTAGRFAAYTGLVPRRKTALVVAVLAGPVRIAGIAAGSLVALVRIHHPCCAGRHPGASQLAVHTNVLIGSR